MEVANIQDLSKIDATLDSVHNEGSRIFAVITLNLERAKLRRIAYLASQVDEDYLSQHMIMDLGEKGSRVDP